MDLRDSRTTCKHDVHALYVSRLKKTACKKAIAKSEHTSDGLGLPKWLVQVAKDVDVDRRHVARQSHANHMSDSIPSHFLLAPPVPPKRRRGIAMRLLHHFGPLKF